MSQYLLSELQFISSKPGIYFFKDKNNRIIYIGKAKNLKKRIGSYFLNSSSISPKTKSLLLSVHKIKVIETESEIQALLLEANYIKKFSPKYNSRLTDGKAYPFIKITVKDIYPKILITRKTNDSSSIYFGPYPNVKAMKTVIRIIRKIFPFQSVINHPPKICLYNHLGLCPCPYLNDSPNLRSEYKKNINHIVDFLNGRIKKVIRDLTRERNEASNKLEFEKAKIIQERINSVIISTNPATRLFNKNFDTNLEEKNNLNLITLLLKEFKKFNIPVNDLRRIECFDISNISGKFATGSMAVFINGLKESSEYRKFKIKYSEKIPNDFAMLKELISRRLNHKDWDYPSLIVVDGGKGQISTILKMLTNRGLMIPIIGLAKRDETIVTPSLEQIKLRKDSPALHLLMKIRDEAHRFALSYHRLLRSKNFIVQ